MEKRCTKCKITKSMGDFFISKNGKDGLESQCKECHRERGRAYSRRKDVRAKRNAYFKTPEGKEYKDEHNLKYRSENPEKVKAHWMVGNAIRYHKIPKASEMPCGKCGEPAEHYHHEDYSRPLDIVPLCHRCHENVHHASLIS